MTTPERIKAVCALNTHLQGSPMGGLHNDWARMVTQLAGHHDHLSPAVQQAFDAATAAVDRLAAAADRALQDIELERRGL